MSKSIKCLFQFGYCGDIWRYVGNMQGNNLEYFGNDGEMIEWSRGDELLWYRNMKERWGKFNVEIISDIEIPVEIDQGKVRLTLVKKIDSKNNQYFKDDSVVDNKILSKLIVYPL